MEYIRHKQMGILEMKNTTSKREQIGLSAEEKINKLRYSFRLYTNLKHTEGKKNQIYSMCVEEKGVRRGAK